MHSIECISPYLPIHRVYSGPRQTDSSDEDKGLIYYAEMWIEIAPLLLSVCL